MRLFIICFLSIFISSCSFPTYVFQNKHQTIGVDFSKGKWLLNEINAPRNISDRLTKLAIKDFSKYTDGNLNYTISTNNLLMQKITKTDLSVYELKNLKLGTGYDYFINIKASFLKNEIGNINIRNHKYQQTGAKEVSIILEVYDLNNSKILYNQEVIGFVKLPQNSDDVTLSYSLNNLIIGSYKKIIRDINKKSIKR